MLSPSIKTAVETEVGKGIREIYFDLEGCTGMDSTFMGMLAGVAMHLRKNGGGTLTIVESGGKSQASLQELGLSQLMEINPSEGSWIGKMIEIRSGFAPLDPQSDPGKEGHILECHENLCEADDENNDRFRSVLEVLKASGK